MNTKPQSTAAWAEQREADARTLAFLSLTYNRVSPQRRDEHFVADMVRMLKPETCLSAMQEIATDIAKETLLQLATGPAASARGLRLEDWNSGHNAYHPEEFWAADVYEALGSKSAVERFGAHVRVHQHLEQIATRYGLKLPQRHRPSVLVKK